MLKILYAADNRRSSALPLQRFVDTYQTHFEIKIAAYSRSVGNHANWTLDALLDFRKQYPGISFKSGNYPLYRRAVRRFAPDLIISDLEPYTSYIGFELGIPVWQVSSLLLHYATDIQSNLFKYYSGLFYEVGRHDGHIARILQHSQRRLVSSHLCDITAPPTLHPDYQWTRPNYQQPTDNNNLSYGLEFADAYYAGKPSIAIPDYNDFESLVACHYNHHFGLSALANQKPQPFDLHIDSNVHFLSQHLETLDI